VSEGEVVTTALSDRRYPARMRPAPVRLLGPSVLALLLLAGAAASGASAVQTPPPTPVDGKPSPFVTDLETPEPSAQPPEIRSPAGLLADMDTGQVVFERGVNDRRPIASITKLMTALLVVERTRPQDVVTVSPNAAPSVSGYHGSELDLRPGEEISVEHLLQGLLIQSSNDAAIALAEHVSGSVGRFVELMNTRARRLGMTRTEFTSPNGLDDAGRSTASDLVVLTRAIYEHRDLARIVRTKVAEIPAPRGKPRSVQNRNVLLWLYPGALGVKTGYTVEAKFCLVSAAERGGLRLIAVVLGNPEEPFSDAAALLNYGFEAFERRTFVEDGEDLGTVEIPGGSVGAVASGSLTALVPTAEAETARPEFVADPGIGFPAARGERIGVLRIAVPGGAGLGEVPVVAAAIPAPRPPEGGPWWRRTLTSVADALGSVIHAVLG
jgi:serine-type D-Ala-D-Ala carboxypeptidase (penicillin-binding protein 5/6)